MQMTGVKCVLLLKYSAKLYTLLQGFPFRADGEDGLPELSRLVGTLDRDLGLSALFRASVTPVRPSVGGPIPVLFLDPVDSTHSMRYLSATGKEDPGGLLELVALGLSLVKKHEPQQKKQAIQVGAWCMLKQFYGTLPSALPAYKNV